MSETDHTQKRCSRHSAIYQTIKALAILRCFYGSEVVLLGVVIGKCDMPSTAISQENDHAILIVKSQFVTYKFRYV
jgi:stage V sporulation protein SpoVS